MAARRPPGPALLLLLVPLLGLPLQAPALLLDVPSDTPAYQLRESVKYVGTAKFPAPSAPPPAQPSGSATASAGPRDATRRQLPRRGIRLRARAHASVAGGASLKGRAASVVQLRANQSAGANNLTWGFDGMDAWEARYAGSTNYSSSHAFISPPDVSGCLGAGYIVQLVNIAIAVYNTSGQLLAGPVTLLEFLGLYPLLNSFGLQNDLVTDASCLYDKSSGRFFFSLLWASQGQPSPWDRLGQGQYGSGIAVGVSAYRNPVKAWNIFFIPTTNTGSASNDDTKPPLNYTEPPFQGDFPRLGVDANGVFVTANQIGGFLESDDYLAGRNIYCLGKSFLTKGKAFTGVRFAMPGTAVRDLGAIEPVRATADPGFRSDGARRGTMYFASLAPFSQLAVWAVVDTACLNFRQPWHVSLHLRYVPIGTFQAGPSGVAQREGELPFGSGLGVTTPPLIDTNSDTPNVVAGMSVCLLPGPSLWMVWTVGLGKAAPTATAVAQVNVSFTGRAGAALRLKASLGVYKFLYVAKQAILFPAISYGGQGRLFLAFSLVGTSYFPSAAFTFLSSEGAVHELFYIAAPGKFPYEDQTGYSGEGITRFGDWNTVTVDEHMQAWAFVEYVSGAHQNPPGEPTWSNWAVRIFKLEL